MNGCIPLRERDAVQAEVSLHFLDNRDGIRLCSLCQHLEGALPF